MLKDPFLTTRRIKANLELVAKTRTISQYITRLGWRKVNTKYCQIVTPINRVKRFIYACLAKLNNEQFEECLNIDETTVELRHFTYKNWNKPETGLFQAARGKIGKPKHNLKIHLFGGISRLGLTPLVKFTDTMHSKDLQNFLRSSVLPFVHQKMPYRHRLFMDNNPKHTSHSSRRFLILNNNRI